MVYIVSLKKSNVCERYLNNKIVSVYLISLISKLFIKSN